MRSVMTCDILSQLLILFEETHYRLYGKNKFKMMTFCFSWRGGAGDDGSLLQNLT